MAIYQYKGLDKSGKEIKNSVNADTLVQAKSKLRTAGIMLIDIKEQKTDAGQVKTISLKKGVGTDDLALMTRQLATLIHAKIQIVEALSALVDQTENPQLKVILAEIKQKVNEGVSMAAALKEYPNVFDTVYCNMVDAGEASGNLDVVLLRLAEFTENQMKLRNRIKGAMVYPLIMVVVGSIMMSIIFIFVIPKITRIFKSMKKTLPIQTRVCIWISDFLKSYWWAVIIAVFASYYLFKKYIKTEKGKSNWDRFLLKAPLVGQLTMMINVSRFCSTLATLLRSGVPILTSMQIVKNLISNVHMQKAVEESRVSIREGASMVTPLKKSMLFPSMVTHMISLGEKSGELEPMLNIVAKNYEDEVDNRLNGLTSTLEPIMMVGMGLAVAFIVFSIIAPMMELNSVR
jgi:general secretion pathway protein F